MKRYEVVCGYWRNGSGFSHSETMEVVEEKPTAIDYIKGIEENIDGGWWKNQEDRSDKDPDDYKITIVEVSEDDDGNETRQEIDCGWVSEVIDKPND